MSYNSLPFVSPRSTLSALICLLACLQAGNAFGAGAANSSKGLLLVANKGDHTVGIIDPDAGRQIAAVDEEGVTGHELVAAPDGKRVFVPIFGNAGVGKAGTDGQLVRVIDIGQRKIVGTVDLGKGVRPHCAVIGPKDGLLYITTELDNSITIIDPTSLKVVGRVPTGQPESHMLAISSDGTRGYTANVAPGTVSVLDLKARNVLKIIQVCQTTQRISISPDDRWVFTADQVKPRLAVIDTATNGVSTWISLPATGYGTAPSPDGRWLVVALPKINQVAVIDLATMKLARTIEVPKSPQEVLVRPGGSHAYVSCDASRQVAAIDLKNGKVEKLIDAGPGVDGLTWASSTSSLR